MKKILFITIIICGFMFKANSQTTIHGQEDPVVLYDLVGGSFYRIITTDIWVYANGSYGASLPTSTQLAPAPLFQGNPVPDFRPIPCYTAKSDYGISNVTCGPYHEFVENGKKVKECNNTNNVTCLLKVRNNGEDHVIYNPDIN